MKTWMNQKSRGHLWREKGPEESIQGNTILIIQKKTKVSKKKKKNNPCKHSYI
jgi:hypothetical protein